jgi:hypothetical protein
MDKLLLNEASKDEDKNKDLIRKTKHYPPANQEWLNSIYAYNNNTSKVLPSADKVLYKLLKSYFNLYSDKLEGKIKFKLIRPKFRRLRGSRVMIGKPELKHVNDKVIVTVYTYNKERTYYLNKLKRIGTIDKIDSFIPNTKRDTIIKKYGIKILPSFLISDKINNKGIKISSNVKRINNKILTLLRKKSPNIINNNYIGSNAMHINKYIKYYVKRSLNKEIFSSYYKQLLYFNKSKYENVYSLPLADLAKRIYNKNIEFNFVNLKYLYLNSHIFSETLTRKIRNKKNSLWRILNTSLYMFNIPEVNRVAMYNEMYNKKWKERNITIKNAKYDLFNGDTSTSLQDLDILEKSLINNYNIFKQSKYIISPVKNPIKSINYIFYSLNNTGNTLIDTFNRIKNKFVSGIRIEAAGRLTKRYTAARSLFKIKYKGNIRNEDSSVKGLSTVMLRGSAKSNLQFSMLKSKKRIGSFGIKGWVSSR